MYFLCIIVVIIISTFVPSNSTNANKFREIKIVEYFQEIKYCSSERKEKKQQLISHLISNVNYHINHSLDIRRKRRRKRYVYRSETLINKES